MRESAERSFQAYGRPLTTVTDFKYLGRILTASDENWTSVVGNIWKARKIWSQLTSILGRYGAIPRVSGMLFKALVQAVLLFGLDTWVRTPCMVRDLGVFNTGSPEGSLGGNRSGRYMGAGSTRL